MTSNIKAAIAGNNSVFTKGNGYNFTTTIQGLTSNTDLYTAAPFSLPYGFASLPDKQYYATVCLPGYTGQAPFVSGMGGTIPTSSPLDVKKGEAALYNAFNYTLEIKMDEMRARFNDISCKLANGDATQKIFSDLLGELLNWFQEFNSEYLAMYNAHIHYLTGVVAGIAMQPLTLDTATFTATVTTTAGGGTFPVVLTAGSTSAQTTSMTFPVAPAAPTTPPAIPWVPYNLVKPLTTDQTYVNAPHIFIDNDGQVLS
jgi:hypothetical protein